MYKPQVSSMGLGAKGGHDESPAPIHVCSVAGGPARAFKHALSSDPHTLCQKGIIFLIFTDGETEAHRDLVTQGLKEGWIWNANLLPRPVALSKHSMIR